MRNGACFLAISILLGACSTSNDVVSKGPIQKRKYRPGWHIDLGHRERKEPPRPSTGQAATDNERLARAAPLPMRAVGTTVVQPVEVETSNPEAMVGQGIAGISMVASEHIHGMRLQAANLQAPTSDRPPLITAPEKKDRPMNKNAVIGAVLGAIGVAGMLISTVLSLFCFAAMVFGIIAIVQITKRNERGMFLAIFACLSLLAMLALALALQGNSQG